MAIPANIVKIDTNDSTEKIKPQYLSNGHSGKLPIIFFNEISNNENKWIMNFIMIMNLNMNFISHVFLEKLQRYTNFFFFIFNCCLAVPRPTLTHSRGDSLTNPMLITAFVQVRPQGHWEPRNEVGFLSPVERQAGFELGNFRF